MLSKYNTDNIIPFQRYNNRVFENQERYPTQRKGFTEKIKSTDVSCKLEYESKIYSDLEGKYKNKNITPYNRGRMYSMSKERVFEESPQTIENEAKAMRNSNNPNFDLSYDYRTKNSENCLVNIGRQNNNDMFSLQEMISKRMTYKDDLEDKILYTLKDKLVVENRIREITEGLQTAQDIINSKGSKMEKDHMKIVDYEIELIEKECELRKMESYIKTQEQRNKIELEDLNRKHEIVQKSVRINEEAMKSKQKILVEAEEKQRIDMRQLFNLRNEIHALRTEKSNLMEENSALENQLHQIKADNAKWEAKITSMKEEYENVARKNAEYQQKIQKYRQIKAFDKKTITGQQKLIDKLQSQKTAYEINLTNWKKQCIDLQNEVNELRELTKIQEEQIASLKKTSILFDDKKIALKAQNPNLDQNLMEEKYRKEIQVLRKQVQEGNERWIKTKKLVEKNRAKLREVISNSVADLSKINVNITKESSVINTEIPKDRQSAKEITHPFAKETFKPKETVSNEKTGQNQKENVELEKMTHENETLKLGLKSTHSTIKILEEKISDLENTNSELKKNNQECFTKKEYLLSKVREQEYELRMRNEVNSEIRTSLGEKLKKIKNLESTLSDMKYRVNLETQESYDQFKLRQEEVEILNSKIKMLEDNLKKTEENLREYKISADVNKKTESRLQGQLNKIKHTNEQLSNEHNDFIKENNLLLDKCRNVTKDRDSLLEQHKIIVKERDLLLDKLSSKADQHISERNELNLKIHDVSLNKEKLESEIQGYRKIINTLKAEEKENRRLEEENTQIKEALSKTEKELKGSRTEVLDGQMAMDSFKKTMEKKLENLQSKLKENLSVSQQHLEENTGKNNTGRGEINYPNNINTHEKERYQQDIKYKELETEYKQLKKQLELKSISLDQSNKEKVELANHIKKLQKELAENTKDTILGKSEKILKDLELAREENKKLQEEIDRYKERDKERFDYSRSYSSRSDLSSKGSTRTATSVSTSVSKSKNSDLSKYSRSLSKNSVYSESSNQSKQSRESKNSERSKASGTKSSSSESDQTKSNKSDNKKRSLGKCNNESRSNKCDSLNESSKNSDYSNHKDIKQASLKNDKDESRTATRVSQNMINKMIEDTKHTENVERNNDRGTMRKPNVDDDDFDDFFGITSKKEYSKDNTDDELSKSLSDGKSEISWNDNSSKKQNANVCQRGSSEKIDQSRSISYTSKKSEHSGTNKNEVEWSGTREIKNYRKPHCKKETSDQIECDKSENLKSTKVSSAAPEEMDFDEFFGIIPEKKDNGNDTNDELSTSSRSKSKKSETAYSDFSEKKKGKESSKSTEKRNGSISKNSDLSSYLGKKKDITSKSENQSSKCGSKNTLTKNERETTTYNQHDSKEFSFGDNKPKEEECFSKKNPSTSSECTDKPINKNLYEENCRQNTSVSISNAMVDNSKVDSKDRGMQKKDDDSNSLSLKSPRMNSISKCDSTQQKHSAAEIDFEFFGITSGDADQDKKNEIPWNLNLEKDDKKSKMSSEEKNNESDKKSTKCKLVEEEFGVECEESIASLSSSLKDVNKFESEPKNKKKTLNEKEKDKHLPPLPLQQQTADRKQNERKPKSSSKVCKKILKSPEFEINNSISINSGEKCQNGPLNDLDYYSYDDVTAGRTSEDISDQFETDIEDLPRDPPPKPQRKKKTSNKKKTKKEKILPPLKGRLPNPSLTPQ